MKPPPSNGGGIPGGSTIPGGAPCIIFIPIFIPGNGGGTTAC